MWPIIIVVLVIAMSVGPIMMMQPSKSQQRLAKLRQSAASLGFKVGSSSLKTDDGVLCWFYWLPLPEESELNPLLCVKNNYEHGMHLAKYWSVRSGDAKTNKAELEQCLSAMPAAVYAFELNENVIGVHWTETGGQALLEDIHLALKGFIQASSA